MVKTHLHCMVPAAIVTENHPVQSGCLRMNHTICQIWRPQHKESDT